MATRELATVETGIVRTRERGTAAAQTRTPAPATVTKKILRMSELTEVVGLSRAWINKLVRDGAFPRPIKLGPRSRGFLCEEVDFWIAQRAAERDAV
jgi:prophage regulatory protein